MAHIHNFPELNLSPSRLRLNYTLNSKSTKSTIARKSINAIETPPESLTKRILLSPKKIQTDPHTSIMSKLQNELDLEEISLKSNELKNYPEKKRKKAEQKVYSQYMDSIIKRILKTNESLGKLLERGWKGYQDSLLPIKTDTNSDLIVRVNSESASQSTQVSEEMIFSREEKNIDSYIEYLHSALRGINSMNMSKIISKLSELNYSLRPIDVPSASETPEIEEINFSETMKNIHSKFRSKSLKRPKKIEIPEKIPTKDQLSQTLLKMDDLKAMDAYRAIIKVKEDLIGELNLKLRRKDESEEVIKAKNKEIDELKRDFLRLKLDCPNCVIKDKKLKKREFEIKRLKLSSTDNFGVEFEESKKKLEENSQTIILNQNTINQLNSNLKDLESKYHEALLLRDKLQSQLKREETLRKSIEYQLQKQIDSNTALKLINDPFKSPKNTEDLLEIPESNLSKNQTFTSFKKKSSSASPDKKRTIIRADIEAPEVKKSKKETLMSLLNMTKDEYLALSKKARLDIYVCLLQHTKRCGANCSHLQRAMMIRYKNRGPLFPSNIMSITHCALSGNPLVDPVVSLVTGHVYEKSAILSHIQKTGRCPITNCTLQESDLMELKVNPATKPRPLSSATVPGLLKSLQDEWNLAVMENHGVKKQNELLKQELSHALYQCDAACRVIAKLVGEKEELLNAIQELSKNS